jgi:hypothetical protein
LSALDIGAELLSALRSDDGRKLLRELLAPVVADALATALDARAEKLELLGDILNIDDGAAVKRIQRDHGLRALGIPSGKRLLFQRDAVVTYLRAKKKVSR